MAFNVDIPEIPEVWDKLADYSHVLKFVTANRHFSPVDYWKIAEIFGKQQTVVISNNLYPLCENYYLDHR